MFTFNVSGSSSQGRSSQGSAKSNYVPSTFIARQLALEEEARRLKEHGNRHESSMDAPLQAESTSRWPTREDVLAPGYSSGPLGYDLPRAQPARDAIDSKLYPTTFSDAVAEQQAPIHTAPATVSKGILRNDHPELHDLQKKIASVRFAAVAPELQTPRPQSPAVSIFSQGGASPFFSNNSTGHLSNSSSMNNLHSTLKENGKVDVLNHRGAAGTPALNSSLGPALGSVTGVTQATQAYSSSKMLQSELHTSSMRVSGLSGHATTGSAFYSSLDGSARQAGKSPNTFGKTSRDEDEEDKDKERYMPAVLLGTSSGLKGTKIEPFVDGSNGKTAWDSDTFQQTGPSRDTRLAPHLIGEDAPPADTLYDIAQKEKYYSQPTATLSKFSLPNQYHRSTSEGDYLDAAAPVSSLSARGPDKGFDAVITYGFPPEAASYVLNQFRAFGTIVRYESGSYGQVPSESFNWLKIQYEGSWAARNATSRHLQAVGKFIVGVHACQSFSSASTSPPSTFNMAMDTTADGREQDQDQDITRDLTLEEAREVEAGVDTLLRMRAQGLGPDHLEAGGKVGAQANANTRARHTSLYESWSQGGGSSSLAAHAAGVSPFQSILSSSSSTGYSPTRTLSDSLAGPSSNGGVNSMDQEDEDMAYILGHSLTSGGSLARSSRGRGQGLDRERHADFLRSRSQDRIKDTQDGSSSLSAVAVGAAGSGAAGTIGSKRSGADGGILLSSSLTKKETMETGSVGFRPLFGQNESRGLFAGSSTGNQGSFPQHQPQQLHSSSSLEQRGPQESLFGPQHHRLSLRRPNGFGESAASDTTLFASSGGVLLDSGAASSTPYHVQKKQRLDSGLFSSSTPTSVPLSQFGRGRDRSSLLVDDPSLVDKWGAPLSRASQTAASTSGAGASSSSSSSSSAAAAAAGQAKSAATGSAAQGSAAPVAPGSGSMISTVLNMAKKRLFWG
ncbi:hypothetical protein EDD11_010599 [Mortierella claussenii]|nr:hypothetical protein EDD11_010599 [Mortierella claussenii]